jgi:hypothetical protein
VRFTSTAEAELKAAMEFYQSVREGLGAEFLAEMEATCNLIESFPLAWLPLSSRTRRCRTHRFPYGLFLPSSQRSNPNCFCDGLTTRPKTLGRILVAG